MNPAPHCQHCGGPLVDDRCPACSATALFRFVQREVLVLVVLSIAGVLAFFGTRTVARVSADIRERDAAEWYRVGQGLLDAGDADPAADAFRRASGMARENQTYRLALAAALTAAERDEAARQVLLGVREVAPENPDVNLRLARLEARRDDETAAVRYYQNALYGVWSPEATETRGRLRVELIEYLLARGQHGRGLAELLALEGNLPAEPEAYLEAARLFRQAGDATRALGHYERVLELEPKNGDAAAGAGEAAFSLGEYARAQRFLRLAPDDRPDVVELRAITAIILARDPLAPRLAYAERRRRVLLNLEDSIEHLTACPAEDDARAELAALQREAEGFAASLRRRAAAQRLEVIEAGVDLVHRIQRATAERCGASSASHRALLIIGQRYQTDVP